MSSVVIGYLIAVFLMALAYSGVYLNTPTHALYIPTDNECTNPTLWENKVLVSQSCPLADIKNSLITYWNKDNHGEDRDLMLLVIGKKYSKEREDSHILRINMDAVIYEMDKETHKPVQKYFIEYDDNNYGYFINNDMSTNVEIKRIRMHPDRYYQLQVLHLSGFNCKPGDYNGADMYLNGVFLLNGMMWPTNVNKDTYLVRYQKIVFSLSLLFTVIFLFKLLMNDRKRLKSARTWLTLAFTVAVLSYTCPEPWIKAYFPQLRELVTFRQAYIATIFLSACIADISLIHLPPIYNHIAWIAVVVLNTIIVSLKYLATTDTIDLTSTNNIDSTRIGIYRVYETYYQEWSERKIWILYVICTLFFFMKSRANKRWQNMSPALMVLAMWVCCAGRGRLPFKHYELVISKLHLDLAYLPCAVFLYQYLSLSMRDEYEQLPSSDPGKDTVESSNKVM